MFIILSCRGMTERVVRIANASELKNASGAQRFVDEHLREEVAEQVLATIKLPETHTEVQVLRALGAVSEYKFEFWLEGLLSEVANAVHSNAVGLGKRIDLVSKTPSEF